MDEAQLRERARQSIEAFNRADWDDIRARWAPGLAYEETGSGRRIEGADQVMRALQAWKTALPDLTGEVVNVAVDRDTAVLEIVWPGTHTGPLATPSGELPASGRHIETRATMWQRYDGELVVHQRHYLDMLTMLTQLGVLPAAG
jgi:steroid delta-isomerase-like uncharacterized protein